MAKIMLVGLGGTGSRIVIEVEKLVNQLPPESRRDITLATLGIDTHDQYLSEIKDPISSFQMNTDIPTLIKNIDQFPHIKDFWNFDVTPRDTSNGAGGVRILSKVSVYRHCEKLYERIGSIVDRLAAIKGEGNIYVFLVGSLFGGTGSGAFVDIANIISNKLRENLSSTDFRIIGHFFLPSILPYHTDRNFQNTYASLQEYEHIIKTGPYKASYSRSMTDFSTDVPYHNFFLISGFTHGNLTLPHKPEDFYKMVAYKIFYEVISQKLFKEFMGKLIDVHLLAESHEYTGGIRKPTAFSSFGISVTTYPFDNIRRYFSNKIAAGMMSDGFLAPCKRDEVEENDVKDFIKKTSLEKIDRAIRQDKEISFEAEQLRFDKAAYSRPGVSLERMADDLSADYQSMKTTGFDNFYKLVEKKASARKTELAAAFLSEVKNIIKSSGIVRARTFIELLTGRLSRLEKDYHDKYKKFERISDEAALEVVSRELEDVKVKVRTWWPIFKHKKVMKEVDEFIEEANNYVESNMNEILNEYSSILISEFREFVEKFYRPGGRHGPPTGFLERVKLQAESIRRDYENLSLEVAKHIRKEKGRPNEYRVIKNLLSLEELEDKFNQAKPDMNKAYTLLTNEYMPDLLLDPGQVLSEGTENINQVLDNFNIEQMSAEFKDKTADFAYKYFDQRMDVLKPENIIKTLSEDDIVSRIDEMIEYCSPFLGYKKDIARIKRVENTMILIRRAAYNRVKNRIREKYGANYFFIDTDDVDFLMIMKYVHGYDLNSLTEINSIARKFKALRPVDQGKHYTDRNLIGKMQPLLVSDITVVPEETYFNFAFALSSRIGEDFDMEFGPGRNVPSFEFKGRPIIEPTEAGLNYRFLDWQGKEKKEKVIGRTVSEAFKAFSENLNMIDSVNLYVDTVIQSKGQAYRDILEQTWEKLNRKIQQLREKARETRDRELELYEKMKKAVDKKLSEIS